MKEMVGGCCVCSDERGWAENPLVYCDGPNCNVAVHSACYGIEAVPSGNWYCRKCESSERPGRVRCELCPSRDGAFKRTDNGSWAHVVCALYIPEVRFENVSTMEPILISLIPDDRFNQTCYICEERGDKNEVRSTIGACMQCNKPGCKRYFHVTCAQMMGLLCEEAGNMIDNVKYCGYCPQHYSKLVSEEEIDTSYLHRFTAWEPESKGSQVGSQNENGLSLNFQKKTSNLKIIPPFKPIPSGNLSAESPNSSPEKNGKGEAKNGIDGAATAALPLTTTQSDNIQKSGSKPSSRKSSGSGKASSVSSSSSNGSTNNNAPTMPRIQIQPSNLFTSSSGFSSYSSSVVNSSGNRHKSRSKSRSPSSEAIEPLNFERKSGSGGVVGKARAYSLGVVGTKLVEEDGTFKGEGQNGGTGTKSVPELISASAPVSPAPFIPSAFSSKSKDMATVSMKEVITSTIEKQMNAGSKFDRSGSLPSEASFVNSTANACRVDKPPPEIVPHVTLTPIPMKSTEDAKNDRGSTKSPVGFQNFGSSRPEPMETEMATISLEKSVGGASPGKRMRLSLHAVAPPEQGIDSDTESATEEWPLDEAQRSQPTSKCATPKREHTSRRSSTEQQSPNRHLTPSQASPGQWDSRKSPTVSLERLPQAQPLSVVVSGPGLKEGQLNSTNSVYQLENTVPPRKRGPGRPSLKAQSPGAPGRDDETRAKLPGGKRGRRGNSVTNYGRRESGLANGNGTIDETDVGKLDDEVSPVVSNGSGRGGRHTVPSSRKASAISAAPSVQNSPTVSRKPSYDDSPGLTMSQLKAQIASSPEKTSLAPHMFGNALNPASSMAQRMVDTLSQEMETIGAGVEKDEESVAAPPPTTLVGIPFPGKSSCTSGTKMNGLVTPNGPTATVTKAMPQTLEELLERQWEQGSQFLMEQAQHLDISQLLSCLNQLKADNKALEDHVASLCQRKEQLTAINARLSIPLGNYNALGLSLGTTAPAAAIQAKPPQSSGSHQLQHLPQEAGHQGRYNSQGHRYSLESGTHAYQQATQQAQQHHRGSTGSIVTSQQQLYGYPLSQGGSSTTHHQQTPRDCR